MPDGRCSPVLTSSSLFITGERAGTPSVQCLERATGTLVWEQTVSTSRRGPRQRRNSVASPTPVTDGQNVYAFSGDFDLVSYDASGRHRWSTPLGPFASGWGMATSPILVDTRLILQADGDSLLGPGEGHHDHEQARFRFGSCVNRPNGCGAS